MNRSERRYYVKLLASWLVAAATAVAAVGSVSCWFWIIDEPECPISLVK